MSYYDHATYMAFKLEKWAEERSLRNYEREAQICKQKELAGTKLSKQPRWRILFKRIKTRIF